MLRTLSIAFLAAAALTAQWRSIRTVADTDLPADHQLVVTGNNHYALLKENRNGLWFNFFNASRDAGKTWGTELALPDLLWPDLDASGFRVVIAYLLDGGIGNPDRFFVDVSADAGNTWATTELGTPALMEAEDRPAAAIDGTDVYVSWVEDGGNRFIQRSADGGVTWLASPLPTTTVIAPDRFTAHNGVLHSLAIEPDGSTPDALLIHSRSIDGGASWTRQQLNVRQPGTDYRVLDPRLVVSRGRASVQYLERPTRTTADLAFVTSADDGSTWSSPIPMNDTVVPRTTQVTGHDLAADGDDLLSVHTQRSVSGGVTQVLARTSTIGGTEFSASAAVNRQIVADTEAVTVPRCAISGDRCVATWLDSVEQPGRIILTGATSIDGGSTWNPSGRLGGPISELHGYEFGAGEDGAAGIMWVRESDFQTRANAVRQPFLSIRGSYQAGDSAYLEISHTDQSEDGRFAFVFLSATGNGSVTGGFTLPDSRQMWLDLDGLTFAGVSSAFTFFVTTPLADGSGRTPSLWIPPGIFLGDIWGVGLVVGAAGLGSITDTVKLK